MRKETHTPGPWVMQERKDGMGSLPNRNSIEIVHNYAGGEGQQVIVGKHTGIDCLSKTNAQLIAAAPELLRTLTNLINATNVNADELDPLTVFIAIEQAKGAIAKATGDV